MIFFVSILVAVIVTGICLFFIIYPLFQKDVEAATVSEEKPNDKKDLYATLNELEMDYNMKKLSKEDYEKLRRVYEAEIVELIQKEQQESSPKEAADKDLMDSLQAEIEEELEMARQERKGRSDD